MDLYNNGLLTTTDLNRTVPATSGPLGNRWVFLGDSITAGSTQNSTNYQYNSWPLWASLFSAGRIWMVRNAGIGGNTSAAMLARFDADVAPHKPSVVCLMAGTNDVGQDVPLATFQGNVRAIHAKTRELGAALVLCTITPTADTVRNPTRVKWNHWLARYAAENGLHLFDAYGVMVDRTTGTLRAADQTDGTHPLNHAVRHLGKAFADVFTPETRQFSLPLVQDEVDAVTAPFTTNRLLTLDTNSDGIPDGWTAYGGPVEETRFTHRLVDNPYGIGKLMQVTQSGNTNIRVLQRSLPAESWTVGERVAFMGVLSSDGGITGTVQLKFTNGAVPNSITPARIDGGPITGGVFYYDALITTGTTGLVAELVASTGTGTVAMGQVSVLNLTRLGLA